MFFLYILWMLGRLISGNVSFAAIIPSFESHDHMSNKRTFLGSFLSGLILGMQNALRGLAT